MNINVTPFTVYMMLGIAAVSVSTVTIIIVTIFDALRMRRRRIEVAAELRKKK